jgi:hypothetical protein
VATVGANSRSEKSTQVKHIVNILSAFSTHALLPDPRGSCFFHMLESFSAKFLIHFRVLGKCSKGEGTLNSRALLWSYSLAYPSYKFPGQRGTLKPSALLKYHSRREKVLIQKGY